MDGGNKSEKVEFGCDPLIGDHVKITRHLFTKVLIVDLDKMVLLFLLLLFINFGFR